MACLRSKAGFRLWASAHRLLAVQGERSADLVGFGDGGGCHQDENVGIGAKLRNHLVRLLKLIEEAIQMIPHLTSQEANHLVRLLKFGRDQGSGMRVDQDRVGYMFCWSRVRGVMGLRFRAQFLSI